MGEFFTAILKKLGDMLTWIGSLLGVWFGALWTFGTDLIAWQLENLLDIVIWMLNQFDVNFDKFNPAQYINGLPVEMVEMIGYIRLGESFAIIFAAILIRIGLQLIPFTRLGS